MLIEFSAKLELNYLKKNIFENTHIEEFIGVAA